MSDSQPDAKVTARPNGLASLTAKRERARRAMPPPRHPRVREATADPSSPMPHDPDSELPEPAAPLKRETQQPAPDVALKAAAAPEKTAGAEPTPPTPSPSPEEIGATFKVTLYVDRSTDEFMEAARVAGLTSRPKVDVSRSAVMRLALRRLMDDMTPEQVKQHLEAQAVRTTGPGRRRR
ncbi:hypothetical protein [Vallicoccus soli]|uniref:Uncharacterized protein n=1 Tax=Vallicoccus soli TaxID=2339232 RepID=A0A3A3YX24_9ACTN|nr:hypothetical protein [Vallicoccus soli]RJK92529.1 hypothetical protein D5H78_18810 [Vallicoccus soli]